MPILEIEEFSTIENIVKFLNGVNMPNFISKYFDREPEYQAAVADVGGTVLTFLDHPLEIGVSSEAELSVFVDFRLERPNDLKILNFIDKNSTCHELVEHLGSPDFSINEERRIELGHNTKIMKYFINDKYSISFDYNEKVEMVRIFTDSYR